MAQVTDPPTPYLGTINSFTAGHMIRIQGLIPGNAQRFNINLQCGSNVNPRDDVALHISVRLLEGYVARNSLETGLWGNEEGDGALKIGPGQRFEILLLSDGNEYKIAINGHHFATFPHRISPSRITHVAIDGDVQLGLISQEGGAAPDASHQATAASEQFGHQLPSAPPPAQQQYGGYGGPPMGAPTQGGYGYGGPVQGGGYGPPPPPPGHQPEQEGGLSNIFGQASSLIAGAISSGMAEKLIGSLTSGGSAHNAQGQGPAQYPHPEPPRQPDFHLPQIGGQGSLGALGGVGSLLSGFAEQILHQPKRQQIGFILPNTAGALIPPLPNQPPAHYPNQNPSYPPLPQHLKYHPSNPKQQGGQFYPYQQQSHGYPGQNMSNSNSTSWTSKIPGGAAMGAMAGGVLPMLGKGGKKMKKSKMKKAMKYGLPIAGAGVGAYALSHAVGGHHWRKGGSSSSSSSSSD